MKKIILLNGQKRSGKDYSAELLKEILGKDEVNIISFAEPIKKIASELFEISLEDLDDYKNDNDLYGIEIKVYPDNQAPCTIKYTNFRKILQKLGTEAIKPIFGNNVWADQAVKKVQDNEKEWTIIPDFRFISEYEQIKKLGKANQIDVYTVNIFNSDLPEPDNHPSETELRDAKFGFDYVIDNTGQPDIKLKIIKLIELIEKVGHESQ